ncbi:7702_t:CDS:2, partial [Scutellospora calospora]
LQANSEKVTKISEDNLENSLYLNNDDISTDHEDIQRENDIEASKITATYKAVHYKMLCHNCMVQKNNLNYMNLTLEEIVPRTPENIQHILNDNYRKEFSIYNIANAFWKFL